MIYNHKGYELVITYNSESGLWEGNCKSLGIYVIARTQGLLESSFRERVDDMGK